MKRYLVKNTWREAATTHMNFVPQSGTQVRYPRAMYAHSGKNFPSRERLK